MERVYSKKRRLKYRYYLIVVLIIIIILLLAIINIVKSKNKTEISKEQTQSEVQEVKEENNVMVFEVDENKKTEKQEVEKEEEKEEEKEKEEEEEIQEKEEEKKENAEATGTIYLTFDDGPTSDSTPQILDILERKNIKATFFVLHYSEGNEQYIKREHEQGHTIGLHGYTHVYSDVYQSADVCMENFRKIQDQVYQTTGVKSNIIRFLGGSSNTVSKKYCKGIMTEVTARAVNEGFRYFDWNVDSDDAGRAKTSDAVYNNVTSALEPNRKNVVLMHDFAKNQKTIDALERIINFGLENGYVFERITEDTPMVKHGINN